MQMGPRMKRVRLWQCTHFFGFSHSSHKLGELVAHLYGHCSSPAREWGSPFLMQLLLFSTGWFEGCVEPHAVEEHKAERNFRNSDTGRSVKVVCGKFSSGISGQRIVRVDTCTVGPGIRLQTWQVRLECLECWTVLEINFLTIMYCKHPSHFIIDRHWAWLTESLFLSAAWTYCFSANRLTCFVQ